MAGRLSRQRLVTLVVVCGAVLFVFWQLQPGWLLSRATPTGSDVGGNIWTPGFMREHLFPHGRITGWAPDWHAGFPLMVFYFPLPTVAIAVLGSVLPGAVAFKVVTALGLLGLPVAAWAFGRLAGFRFPAPALMSAASVVFLFDHFQPQPRGGDVISTVRSEFAYSIGLAVALVFLGLIARGLAGPKGHEQSLDTGRHRAGAAALLAVIGLCHLYDMTFALAGAAVLFAVRPDRRRLAQLAAIVAVGLLLLGFWVVPFAARLGLTTGGLYPAPSHQLQNILPFLDTCSDRSACRPGQFLTTQVWHLLPVVVLALAGVALSVVRRVRAGVALAVLAVLMAAAYPIQPIHRLQSDRFLPFWFLCLYLLAALGVSELVHEAQAFRLRRSRRYARAPGGVDGTLIAPLVAMLAVVLLVGLPFRSLPAPLHVTDLDQVRVSLRYALRGIRGSPGLPRVRAARARRRRGGTDPRLWTRVRRGRPAEPLPLRLRVRAHALPVLDRRLHHLVQRGLLPRVVRVEPVRAADDVGAHEGPHSRGARPAVPQPRPRCRGRASAAVGRALLPRGHTRGQAAGRRPARAHAARPRRAVERVRGGRRAARGAALARACRRDGHRGAGPVVECDRRRVPPTAAPGVGRSSGRDRARHLAACRRPVAPGHPSRGRTHRLRVDGGGRRPESGGHARPREQGRGRRRPRLVRCRPRRLAGAREGVVLPQLGCEGRRGPVAGHAQLHGGRPDRSARFPALRADGRRRPRPGPDRHRGRGPRRARLARPSQGSRARARAGPGASPASPSTTPGGRPRARRKRRR